MHVRVRLLGKPEAIVVVNSKLTKIEEFRRIIRDKFDIHPKCQRLFYGGKLLENGYTLYDYSIKLNDVIQLMVRAEPEEPLSSNVNTETKTEKMLQTTSNVYQETESRLYSIGDLIDMKDREHGAWFEGKVVRIVYDPDVPIKDTSVKEENEIDSENKPPSESSKESPKGNSKKKGLAEYFKKITRLSKEKKKQEAAAEFKACKGEIGLLYQVQLEAENDAETEYYCKFKEIRPRARNVIEINDLQVGQMVMVNHNTEDITETGYWYDFKIDEIKKLRTYHELIGTLYLGPDAIPQNDTRVRVHDKIFAIEEVIPIAERTEDLMNTMVTPTETRSSPLNCLTCRDDEDKPCKDCGCFLCLGKEAPEKIILCDECNNGFHMGCLSPPLTALPEEDWYCPSCKREDAVVAPGAAKQQRKGTHSNTTRDWGRGMACVGKTKTCAMPANHFGPIPGIEVGMCWRFRIQLSESGVHRPPVSGIHGRDVEGAYSIVLSGGYEDDFDNGFEFTYTGSGGRDLSGNKRTAEQSCDQTLTRENKALARNCCVKEIREQGGDAGDDWRQGKPVRVVRSFKMIKHFPQYAPKEGIRYDGIYKVVKYYPEKGKSGFRVWKYLLRRDDPNPAPWEPDAKQYPIVYPDGYLEAEAEKKALKEKGGKKKKRTLKERNESDDSAAEQSPPHKKRNTRAVNGTPANKKDCQPRINTSPTSIPDMFAKVTKKVSKKEVKEEMVEITELLTKDELDAIAEDTLNAKLWDECLNVSKTGGKKHEFIEHVTKVFLCIICQEVAASPVTTACLHNFCIGCMKEAFKATKSQCCSHCRSDLSKEDLQINDQLKTALRAIMPGYDAGKK